MPLELGSQLGPNSFSTLFNPGTPPAPGQQSLTNQQDANSDVTPPIDSSTSSSPYNFLLGTPGGQSNPGELTDAAKDVLPVDNGDPEFDLDATLATLGRGAVTDPADLNTATFTSWTQEQQDAYLTAWGVKQQAVIGLNVAGGSQALVVTDSAGAVTSTPLTQWAIAQLTPQTPTTPAFDTPFGPDTTDAPADLDPNVYQSWSQDQQVQYYIFWHGTGPAAPILIGSNVDGGAGALVVTLANGGILGTPTATPIQQWAVQNSPTVDAGATFTDPVSTTNSPADLIYTDPKTGKVTNVGATSFADLDPTIFSKLTSEQQAEYLRLNKVASAVIGTNVSGATPLTAVLSPDLPNTVWIVNNLTKDNLAGMSNADVVAVSATDEFQKVIGPALGYNVAGQTTQQAMQAAVNGINAAINQIDPNGGPILVPSPVDGSQLPTNSTPGVFFVTNMPIADRQIFASELTTLLQQLQGPDGKGIANTTEVATQVSAIMARFYQAALAWNQSQSKPSNVLNSGAPTGLQTNVTSADGGSSNAEAYQDYIKQEQAIADAAQQAQQLEAESGSPALDAADTAVFALNSMMNAQQAKVDIATKNLGQIQELLQNVAAMQSLVNNTVNSLQNSTTDTTGLTDTANKSTGAAANNANLSASNLTLAELFSSATNSNNAVLQQFNIQVQNLQLFNTDGTLAQHTASEWNNIGTQLTNLVTQLNQQAQTQTSNLNQMTDFDNDIFTAINNTIGQKGTLISLIGTNINGA